MMIIHFYSTDDLMLYINSTPNSSAIKSDYYRDQLGWKTVRHVVEVKPTERNEF